MTLLGQNFAPVAAENTVKFELPGQTWTAVVTAAAADHLVATAPTDLVAPATGSGTVYRVSVTTPRGVSNIVSCSVFPTTANAFMLRPSTAYITQDPGTGRETLVIGGGTPPLQAEAADSVRPDENERPVERPGA